VTLRSVTRFSVVAFVLCAVYVICSSAQSVTQFEVASIKRNVSGTTSMKFPPPEEGRFRATNFPLKALIAFGYGVLGSQIAGAPDWINSERFDVEARAADTHVTREQYPQMLQALLEDRFKLRVQGNEESAGLRTNCHEDRRTSQGRRSSRV
jgi:hypothetical protein